MSPTARAALLGGGLALLLVAVAVALAVSGVITLPRIDGGAVDRVLVIATAPEDASLVAPFAFVIEPGSTSAQLLDTSERVVVSGTSAESAREAFPYVGGSGVARALSPQTGGETLEWVVVPHDEWADLVDSSGGLSVDLPEAIGVYQDGTLVLLEAGRSTLSGDDAVALAAAVPYIEDEKARADVQSQLAAGISAIVASQPEVLADMVDRGAAESSVEAQTLQDF